MNNQMIRMRLEPLYINDIDSYKLILYICKQIFLDFSICYYFKNYII